RSAPSSTLSPRGSRPKPRPKPQCTASHPRHRLVAQVGRGRRGRRGPRVAEGPSRLDVPLPPDLGVREERRRGGLREAGEAEAEDCGHRLA
ncbi:MAG: hypothetical protein OXC68_11345, partial [Aestuariivita sp.]|nr:hypothetical protein [Aestuariivita sp.]